MSFSWRGEPRTSQICTRYSIVYNWSCHPHLLGSGGSYLNLLLKETLWDYNTGGSSTLKTFLSHCLESLPFTFERRKEQGFSVGRFPLSIFSQSKCPSWNYDSQSIIGHCIKNLGRKARYNICFPSISSLKNDQSIVIHHNRTLSSDLFSEF